MWLVREYPDVETMQLAILALLASGHQMMFDVYESFQYPFTPAGRRSVAIEILKEVSGEGKPTEIP